VIVIQAPSTISKVTSSQATPVQSSTQSAGSGTLVLPCLPFPCCALQRCIHSHRTQACTCRSHSRLHRSVVGAAPFESTLDLSAVQERHFKQPIFAWRGEADALAVQFNMWSHTMTIVSMQVRTQHWVQFAEQEYLQVLSIPLHRVDCPRHCGACVLCIHVRNWIEERFFWKGKRVVGPHRRHAVSWHPSRHSRLLTMLSCTSYILKAPVRHAAYCL
jgi:hypothetical protein